jgi:hypothetical protein
VSFLKSLKPSMPFRTLFVIIVVSLAAHIPFWSMIVILVGYGICEDIDKHFAKKEKAKAINETFDDEMHEWKQRPDKADWEEKGDMDRIKLPQQEQIVVYRVAEIMRRMLLADIK